jgi:SAM-dependent MidA family methyltransferase
MQQEPNMSLPAADAASAAHSNRVADHIRELIANAGGAISFAEYMHHALYAPGLGYYSAGATKFGEAGDFVTAPEISPVFAGVVARQCAEVFASLDRPSLLEVGGGSGRLACDLLKRLRELDALPESCEILEVSADLRERQYALLESEVPDLIERVSWLDRFPESLSGVIIANEVIDALPVERFAIRAEGISQLCVTSGGDSFSIAERAAPELLIAAVEGIERDLGEPLPEGYVSDVCLAAPAWIADLGRSLERGVAFLFDYGVGRREYYARDRSGGWLRCHFRHHAHNNALILPGVQDLTAWVDFSAVATAASDNGLDVAGYVTQAQFLIGGGLDNELAGFGELPIDAQLKLSGQVKLLTLPGEMGENFKCIGLSRGSVTRPTAFKLADRTMSL